MANKIYDAVIVGSGATGGWAAKELCEAGLEVCMLEAGRQLNPATDFTEHKLPFDFKHRNRGNIAKFRKSHPIQHRTYSFEEGTAHMYVDERENPWTTPKKRPFWWIRGRHVGGRTIMWGRQSYRLSDYDFKAASHDGYGDDWPIEYADLKPYYDKVDEFIGVSGANEGLEQLPDGKFLPPMAYTCAEHDFKRVADKMGRRVIMGRCAVLTKDHGGRPACHYCGPCHRGCRTRSYFSSPSSTLPAAAATGRFTLVTNAVVRHVVTNGEGKAEGVFYYDRETKKSDEVRGKVVILCASTLESTRIMFNSGGERFEGGLGNSSGVLGHYLMDHVYGVALWARYKGRPSGMKMDGGVRPNGIYIPRFQNLKEKHGKFIRGYGFQGGESVQIAEHAATIPGFGKQYKQAVRDHEETPFMLGGFGEMLPRFENHCRLDDDKRDAWDIPVLHIDCKQGDNEAAMAEDIMETGREMLEAAGAEITHTNSYRPPPGFAIHECGTARMGNDPKTSVLNSFNQTHDVKNVFVMDGGAFVSIGCQNPTLTMMALTVRACDYLVDEMKRGNLG